MKNQALSSSKDKSKKIKCRLPQFLFGALKVNRSGIPVQPFMSRDKMLAFKKPYAFQNNRIKVNGYDFRARDSCNLIVAFLINRGLLLREQILFFKS